MEIKKSDRQWFEEAVSSHLPPDQQCPHCRAKRCLRSFGKYRRYLVEWDGQAQVCHTMEVPRYQCDSCGRTHALLPSCLIPYGSYSLRFLLIVLRAYFIRTCPVEQVCVRYGITVSMLYRWKQLFSSQKELWLGVLEAAAAQPVSFIVSLDGILLRDFFHAFGFSFLQRPYSTDRGQLFPQSDCPEGIT